MPTSQVRCPGSSPSSAYNSFQPKLMQGGSSRGIKNLVPVSDLADVGQIPRSCLQPCPALGSRHLENEPADRTSQSLLPPVLVFQKI